MKLKINTGTAVTTLCIILILMVVAQHINWLFKGIYTFEAFIIGVAELSIVLLINGIYKNE